MPVKVMMKMKYLKLLPLTLGYKSMLIFLSHDSILFFLLQCITSTQHVPGTLAEKGRVTKITRTQSPRNL